MLRIIFFAVWVLVLVACGDDSPHGSSPEASLSSSSWNNGSTSWSDPEFVGPIIQDEPFIEDSSLVENATNLPSCNASNEGETFMVAAENTLYFCVGGEWRNDVAEALGVSCENGSLSLGAADISSQAPSLFGIDSTGSLVLRRSGVPVAGVAEKGPFRYGTSVSVVELDSVMRLEPSDRIHRTCVVSGDGSYSFGSIDLVSPYVRVDVSGYYKNELTGGLSSDMVTLSTVTDLTERDSVNVNMLTHLEAPRTLKMVENTGNNQPIRAMKEQALRDIFYSFDIVIPGYNDGGNAQGGFGGQMQQPGVGSMQKPVIADDISLFGNGDFSAALIAISVMMQRRGSGSEMLEYAAGIADRIRGNGNWDDWGARADLADWLMVLDTSGAYNAIRKNLENLHQGEVPDFEKYLRNFWTKTYQFPACADTVLGKVTHIGNSQSAFFVSYYNQPDGPRIRFICDGGIGRWRAATDIEKDTVGLGADTAKYDGAFRFGAINMDKSYIYMEQSNVWRPATSDDIMEFTDVADVYAGLAPDEKVVFILRHAERTDDTGKNGHLTETGKKQAQSVGRKFTGAGEFFLAYSGYTRTKETCENIALGNGQINASPEVMAGLDGDWFVKDQNKYSSYKSGSSSLAVCTKYVYRGMYADAFYNLEERTQEFVSDYIIANMQKLNRVNFYISHDFMVLPFAVYASQNKLNLRYFENRNWINYLAGVAVIINAAGQVRYVPVRGLESGSMII